MVVEKIRWIIPTLIERYHETHSTVLKTGSFTYDRLLIWDMYSVQAALFEEIASWNHCMTWHCWGSYDSATLFQLILIKIYWDYFQTFEKKVTSLFPTLSGNMISFFVKTITFWLKYFFYLMIQDSSWFLFTIQTINPYTENLAAYQFTNKFVPSSFQHRFFWDPVNKQTCYEENGPVVGSYWNEDLRPVNEPVTSKLWTCIKKGFQCRFPFLSTAKRGR